MFLFFVNMFTGGKTGDRRGPLRMEEDHGPFWMRRRTEEDN